MRAAQIADPPEKNGLGRALTRAEAQSRVYTVSSPVSPPPSAAQDDIAARGVLPASAVTRAMERIRRADRRYFERHPDRLHRLRRAEKAEVLHAAATGWPSVLRGLPEGHAWFAVIQMEWLFERRRWVIVALPGETVTAIPEDACAELFDNLEEEGWRAPPPRSSAWGFGR